MTATLKKLWKNDYIQTAIIIGSIVLIVLGFWFSVQLALNTSYPALAVVTGSMCIPQDATCNGWTHPFDRTLHVGDLIIIQGVAPEDLNADYPNSDIIVFHKPTAYDELIVHRIAAKGVSEDGILYFYTKGDGNPINTWPNAIRPSEYDPWGKVNENLVVGKVIMRIPWVGHAILFMRSSMGLPIVITLILIIVIIEFVLPLLKRKAPAAEPEPLETGALEGL